LYGSDDIRPFAGWWDVARERLESDSRIGLLATNDSRHPLVRAGKLAVHGVLRRSYVERYGSASLSDAGPVFWEGYRHWNCDVEVSYVARARGAFAYEKRSVLQHADPRAKPNLMDSTYKLGRSFAGADRAKRAQRCPGWPEVANLPKLPVVITRSSAPIVATSEVESVQAVMISCEQRVEARAMTIPQFERLGFTVKVALSPCRPASPVQNGIASTHALHEAYAEGKHCLFLEDDIDVDGDLFLHFLQRAIDRDAVTYFYNHDKEQLMQSYYGEVLAKRIMRGLPIRRDLYPVKHTRQFLNAQAIFLPYWFYAPIVESGRLQSSRTSFDVFLGRYLEVMGETAYVALPNPVWHRHDRTARVGMGVAGKQTKSFGLLWFEDGENEEPELPPDTIDFRAENVFQYERLLPLWFSLPAKLRGHFYVPYAASRVMEGYAMTLPAEKMPPEGGRTVILVASEESTWASGKAATKFPNRNIITIGGDRANARFTSYGYPHLVFTDFGQSRSSEPKVGFLLSRRETIARHCRFLPKLARSAAESALLPSVFGRDHDDSTTAILPPVHLPFSSIGSVLGTLNGLGRDWFNKHGIVMHHQSLQVLNEANVIITDDEFFAMEAIALGKPAFMMNEAEALTPVAANENLKIVDADDFIQALLEVTK
jgi:hypothetical protein